MVFLAKKSVDKQETMLFLTCSNRLIEAIQLLRVACATQIEASGANN